MTDLRNIYAQKGLCQLPRLLSSEDRNLFSPTYGCMNREFWLCRATDFPNSIAQFGVHALALAYANQMPNNPYYQHPKILEWTLAGMDYWTKIQLNDGSFDEFYPNERGWAGPTGFLLYVMCDSMRLLEGKIPAELNERLLKAVHKAGLFLSGTDESGVLANHHAMAILPMYESYLVTQDKRIEQSFQEKLTIFFGYCYEEGWCLEYDGADPGYLSATISFMSKLAKYYKDDRFDPFFQKAVEFSSYFVYPNGHYAGTAGSRQTLHFYPHGYELLADQIPLAGSIANRMLEGLRDGALVPPEIQGERYFVYRIPELLLSYADYGKRADNLPPLPYERQPFKTYFTGAKVLAKKTAESYTLVNAAKGGVVKHFDLNTNKICLNNCGIWGQLEDGRLFTSQWIDESTQTTETEDGLSIHGRCHKVPTKIFNPFTFIGFRIFMLAFGWHERIAYHLKGLIRKILMLGAKPMPLQFKRKIKIEENRIEVTTQIELEGGIKVSGLLIGDEFPARYVPQSRYFQPQELDVRGYHLNQDEVSQLNKSRKIGLKEMYEKNWVESKFETFT